jgi:hypothetical protein
LTVQPETSHPLQRTTLLAAGLVLFPILAFSEPVKKEFRYTVGPGTNLTVVN